jgi:hypothetical protein
MTRISDHESAGLSQESLTGAVRRLPAASFPFRAEASKVLSMSSWVEKVNSHDVWEHVTPHFPGGCYRY